MTNLSEENKTGPAPKESLSDEFPKTHLERDDDRWSRKAQSQDWLFLALMIVIYLAWVGVIYLFEPGIR